MYNLFAFWITFWNALVDRSPGYIPFLSCTFAFIFFLITNYITTTLNNMGITIHPTTLYVGLFMWFLNDYWIGVKEYGF